MYNHFHKYFLKDHGSVGEKKPGFPLRMQTLANSEQFLEMALEILKLQNNLHPSIRNEY